MFENFKYLNFSNKKFLGTIFIFELLSFKIFKLSINININSLGTTADDDLDFLIIFTVLN